MHGSFIFVESPRTSYGRTLRNGCSIARSILAGFASGPLERGPILLGACRDPIQTLRGVDMVVNLRGWRCLVAVLAVLILSTSSVAVAAKRPIESPPEMSGLVSTMPEVADLSAATGAVPGKVRVMVELLEPPAAVAYAKALRENEGIGRKRASAIAGQASRAQFVAVETSQAS